MFRLMSARKRDESGVVAILVALLALVMLMFAAYAVDIGLQINRKHQLIDALDAAAQAGAYDLPGSSITARADALAFARAHDNTETGTLAPTIDFWCVLASKLSGGSYVVDTTQIPATCNPGTAPYTVGATYKSTGRLISCSPVICAIPCVEPSPNTTTPIIACNTIRVYQGRDVPFAFAPAGGIAKGSTGTLISVACKGSCGTINPNPLDVAVVADRTPSMDGSDLDDMIAGIQGMLAQMTPSQQYVALGTIGRSAQTTTSAAESRSCNSTSKGLSYPSASGTSGLWMPISFQDDYGDGTGALTSSNPLVAAVSCLQYESPAGTFLAAPLKAAARYVLGYDANNLSSLPARSVPAQKVIIFETDGQPYENQTTRGTTSLGDPADIFSALNHYTTGPTSTTGPVTSGPVNTTDTRTTGSGSSRKTWTDTYKTTYRTTTSTTLRTIDGGQTACDNFGTVADNAKAQGILVITIAYNLGGDIHCGDNNSPSSLPSNTSSDDDSDPVITSITPSGANSNGTLKTTYAGNATINQTVTRTTTNTNYAWAADALVRNTLADAASPVNGVASAASNTCGTAAEQAAENSDGDYFFCAASGTDMAPIFKTALSQATKGIKLIRIP